MIRRAGIIGVNIWDISDEYKCNPWNAAIVFSFALICIFF